MAVWALILDTYREMIDKKLFWIQLLLTGMVAAAMACIHFDEKGLHLLFGWKTIADPMYATTSQYYRLMISHLLSGVLVKYYIGWLGCILGLLSTAGIFPALMLKGTMETIAARPPSRWTIFLAKYVGALLFMAIQATVFVLLTFFIVGLRWKAWFPGYLWSVPLLILLFSFLYCLCAVFAIWTRSALASFLLTMAAWLVVIAPAQIAHDAIHGSMQTKDWNKMKRVTTVLRWVLPNTADIPRIVQRQLDARDPTVMVPDDPEEHAFFTPQETRYMLAHEQRMAATPWIYPIGSSLLFEAVVLLLAGWRFSRQDF